MTKDEPSAGVAGSLRERRRALTRQEIAAAALDLFERQGYDATTVEQIATAASVSLRTFYRYCDSKDDVLTHELLVGPTDLVARIAEHTDLDLREAIVAGFVEATTAHGGRRMLKAMIDMPALRGPWLAAGRQARDSLVGVFLQRRPDSSDITNRSRASAVIGALTSVVEIWADGEDVSLEELAREALAVIEL